MENKQYEEYRAGLKKLEEKEKEIISRYQIARAEYFKRERELDEMLREIEKYKESFGIYPNVR